MTTEKTLEQTIQKMAERLNELPVEIRRRAFAMKGISQQLQGIKDAYNNEVASLEMRYQDSLKRYYDERATIVSGEGQTGAGIPSFWLQCLLHNDITSHMISSKDKALLQSLQNISFEYIENDISKGFVLNFHFESSNFFDKCVLRKMYYQEFIRGEPILIKTEGTDIPWKSPELDLTKAVRQSSKRNAPGSSAEGGPSDSFFNFFNPPTIPENEDDEEIDYESLEIEIEMDYELGMAIKNQIIPFAVDYFVGERH